MGFRDSFLSIGTIALFSAIGGGLVTAVSLVFLNDASNSSISLKVDRLATEVRSLRDASFETRSGDQAYPEPPLSKPPKIDFGTEWDYDGLNYYREQPKTGSNTSLSLLSQVSDIRQQLSDLKWMIKTTGSPFDSALAVESAKIDALVTGSAAVSAPSSAKKGVGFRALLRIKRSALQPMLESQKKEIPENSLVLGKTDVKMTPRMTATLAGNGFDISPKDAVTQAVSDKEETTWEWNVRATDSGLLPLRFVLTGTLMIQGSEVPRQFYAYTQSVDVSVGIKGFLREYWQWIATSLIIPVLGGLWALVRRQKNSPGPAQASFREKMRKRGHPL